MSKGSSGSVRDLHDSFLRSCRSFLDSRTRSFSSYPVGVKRRLKDLLTVTARRKKSPPSSDEDKKQLTTNSSDVLGLIEAIRMEDDASPRFTKLVSDCDAGTIDGVRDEMGWSVAMHLTLRGHCSSLMLLHGLGCSMDAGHKIDLSSPASVAARSNDLETLKVLISLGASVDRTDANGWTPLHWASAWGHAIIVEFIIVVSRAIINAQNFAGDTALHLAARNRHETVIMVLCQQGGARLDIVNAFGERAFDASEAQRMTNEWFLGAAMMNKILTQNSNEPLPVSETVSRDVLRWKALTKETGVVEPLILSSTSPIGQNLDSVSETTEVMQKIAAANKRILTAARIGVGHRACKEIDHAVADGGCVNTIDQVSGMTPLMTAVVRGETELVKRLLEQGSDILIKNKGDWTALHFACGRPNILEILISSKKFIPDPTLVIRAVESDCFESAILVLDKVGELSDVSVLVSAARQKDKRILENLISRSPVKSWDWSSALLEACRGGLLKNALCLLEKGSGNLIQVRDESGRTGLMLMARLPDNLSSESDLMHELVDRYLERGVSLDLTDNAGNTALATAARTGKEMLCNHLLRRGATVTSAAVQSAAQAGFQRLAQLIELRFLDPVEQMTTPTSTTGIGFSRNQNLGYLVQQLSTPLGLRIENVPPTFSVQALSDLFVSRGSKPSRIRLVVDSMTGRSEGFGFAEFSDRFNFQFGAKLDDLIVEHRRIKIFIDDSLITKTAPPGNDLNM